MAHAETRRARRNPQWNRPPNVICHQGDSTLRLPDQPHGMTPGEGRLPDQPHGMTPGEGRFLLHLLHHNNPVWYNQQTWPGSSMDRALVFGTKCWGFDSLPGHHVTPPAHAQGDFLFVCPRCLGYTRATLTTPKGANYAYPAPHSLARRLSLGSRIGIRCRRAEWRCHARRFATRQSALLWRRELRPLPRRATPTRFTGAIPAPGHIFHPYLGSNPLDQPMRTHPRRRARSSLSRPSPRSFF